jgi:cytosine/adenosine deaminase-related metal-dependent hydrolase
MSVGLLVGPDRTGRSVAVVDGLVAAAAPSGARALPCPQGEIAPGAVCAHTHLYSGLARLGLPPPSPPPQTFVQILERVWWRLDRALDAPMLRASARDYVSRALLAGTTTLVDHHESPSFIDGSLGVLAEACQGLGVRALLCYGATERNFGREEAARGLEECKRIPTTPLLRGLVGLHASFTVGDRTVRAAGDLARALGTVLHVHVAEDRADVEDARARGHAGPLQRLEALGALVPGSILAHGVHLSRAEVERAGALGCWLVQNPRSNEGNKVGYPNALRHAPRVALGTDGWEADMAVEEAALRRLAVAAADPAPEGRLAAGQALVAERFGAAAVPLAPGALGDLVVREDGRVKHVVVGGRLVVEDGRLATGDVGEIEAGARRELERLRERMAQIASSEA